MNEEKKQFANDEPEYQVYPSIERAEDNLRYRTGLYSPLANTKSTPKKTYKKRERSIDDKPKKDEKSKKSAPKKANLESKSENGIIPLTEKDKATVLRLAKAAKQEDLVESQTSGRAPVMSRMQLVDKFMSLHRRGIRLTDKQLKYTMNFLYWHPEIIKAKHIRFLIPATVETMGYPEAIKMTNELASVLEDTPYEEPLKQYSKWLGKRSMVVKIAELRGTGMTNAQIGEKLNISSAEVAVLADDNEKFIFKDEGER